MASKRDNLLAVFHHQRPEWVPVVTHIDSYQIPSDLPAEVSQDLDTITLSRYLDVDILARLPVLTATYYDLHHVREEVGDCIVQRWETPLGTITYRDQTVVFGAEAGDLDVSTPFPVEYALKSAADIPAYRYVVEHTVYGVDLPAVARMRERIGEDGVVTGNVPSSPLMDLARRIMGPELLAYTYYDHPRELGDLIEAMNEKYLEGCRLVAQTAIDGTINYDDTSTRLISRRMFAELEVPYLRRAADIVQSYGKFYVHHCCGHLQAFLQDFAQTGVDGWDALTPPPDGDVRIAEARASLGNGMVLMPLVPQTIVDRSSLDELRACVRSIFAEATPTDALVLWAVPSAGVPMNRFWVLIDEAKKWSHAGISHV